jgi:hypothetical protein
LKIDGEDENGYETATLVEIQSEDRWVIVDDTVMGGRSRSSFSVEIDKNDNEKYINFKGVTNVIGGGICIVRTRKF